MARLSLGTAAAGATVNAHRVGAAASLGPVVTSAVADHWGGVRFPADTLHPGEQYVAALADGTRLCSSGSGA
jgi:hypothetical protein